GQIYPFVLTQRSAVYDASDDVGGSRVDYLELEFAVTDEDAVARSDFSGEQRIVSREPRCVAFDLLGSYANLGAFFEENFVVLKLAGSNCGAGQIEHYCDRPVQIGGNRADSLDDFTMVGTLAV